MSHKINLGSGAVGGPCRGTSAAKQTERSERWRGWEALEILLALYSAPPDADPAQGLPEALGSFWGSSLEATPPRQGCHGRNMAAAAGEMPGWGAEQGHWRFLFQGTTREAAHLQAQLGSHKTGQHLGRAGPQIPTAHPAPATMALAQLWLVADGHLQLCTLPLSGALHCHASEKHAGATLSRDAT